MALSKTDEKAGFLEALSESRRLLQAAREEAQRLEEKKQQDLALKQEQIHAELNSLRRSYEEQLQRQIARQKQCALRELEQQALTIVLQVAEAVIGQSLVEQPESILERIKQALSVIRDSGDIHLILAPPDEAIVRQERSKLSHSGLGPLPDHCIQYSSELEPGSFRLETPLSRIESNPAKHLAAIQAQIREKSLFDLDEMRNA